MDQDLGVSRGVWVVVKIKREDGIVSGENARTQSNGSEEEVELQCL